MSCASASPEKWRDTLHHLSKRRNRRPLGLPKRKNQRGTNSLLGASMRLLQFRACRTWSEQLPLPETLASTRPLV